MPADMHERTPGVYVRADGLHELDMLWSNSRSYHREDRSPILFFLAGLILGVIATAAVFILIINPPKIQTGENIMTAPLMDDVEAVDTPTADKTPNPAKRTGSSTPANMAGATHTVASGETLGSIAGKHYGSTAPEYVDKIQRANNMASPDSLQIGQKLVIPPKNY